MSTHLGALQHLNCTHCNKWSLSSQNLQLARYRKKLYLNSFVRVQGFEFDISDPKDLISYEKKKLTDFALLIKRTTYIHLLHDCAFVIDQISKCGYTT